MRRIGRPLGVVLVVLAGLGWQARPASAASGFSAPAASQFVSAINALRVSVGEPALAVSPALATMAQHWTSAMVSAGTLSHDPRLAQEAPAGWQLLGQNVGVGPDVASLEAAFEASPEHWANLVQPRFSQIGVAVYAAPTGTLWVTEDFMQPPGFHPAFTAIPAQPVAASPSATAAPVAAPQPSTAPSGSPSTDPTVTAATPAGVSGSQGAVSTPTADANASPSGSLGSASCASGGSDAWRWTPGQLWCWWR